MKVPDSHEGAHPTDEGGVHSWTVTQVYCRDEVEPLAGLKSPPGSSISYHVSHPTYERCPARVVLENFQTRTRQKVLTTTGLQKAARGCYPPSSVRLAPACYTRPTKRWSGWRHRLPLPGGPPHAVSVPPEGWCGCASCGLHPMCGGGDDGYLATVEQIEQDVQPKSYQGLGKLVSKGNGGRFGLIAISRKVPPS